MLALKGLSVLLFLYIFLSLLWQLNPQPLAAMLTSITHESAKLLADKLKTSLSPLISPADLAANPERRMLSGNHSALISYVTLLSSDLVSCCSQRETELLRLKCVSVCVHMCISACVCVLQIRSTHASLSSCRHSYCRICYI